MGGPWCSAEVLLLSCSGPGCRSTDVPRLGWAHRTAGRPTEPKGHIPLKRRCPSVPSPLHFRDVESEVKMGKMPHQGNSECLLTSRELSFPPPPLPQPPFRHLQAFLFPHRSGTTGTQGIFETSMSEQLSLPGPRALRNLQRKGRLLSAPPPPPRANRPKASQEERVEL